MNLFEKIASCAARILYWIAGAAIVAMMLLTCADVILRYFRDMPIREIAAVLGCSEGVTRNLLFRSVCKLREVVTAE